jgi:hypothetical protein
VADQHPAGRLSPLIRRNYTRACNTTQSLRPLFSCVAAQVSRRESQNAVDQYDEPTQPLQGPSSEKASRKTQVGG